MSEPIKIRPGNPAMVKGAPSLNPQGRPSVGDSLSNAVRQRFPVERIVDIAEALATGAASEQVRFAALNWLADRGHGKVREAVDLSIGITPEQAAHLEALKLSPHQRRQRLAELGEEESDELAPEVDDGVDDA